MALVFCVFLLTVVAPEYFRSRFDRVCLREKTVMKIMAADSFPLHECVFKNDVRGVSQLLRTYDVAQKDIHGRFHEKLTFQLRCFVRSSTKPIGYATKNSVVQTEDTVSIVLSVLTGHHLSVPFLTLLILK